MLNFKKYSEMGFNPNTDLNTNACLKESGTAMHITNNMIGKLQGFDLQTIFDMKFNKRSEICKNMIELKNIIANPVEHLKLLLAFATTINFCPSNMGYKFQFEEQHQLAQVEKMLLNLHSLPLDLMPLHNLFRLLDNKQPEFIDATTDMYYLDCDDVNALFPYFQIVRTDTCVNHYLVGFTRLDLLSQLNSRLEASTNLIGFTIYKFLNMGESSKYYSKKYFDRQAEKLQIAA